MAERAKIIGLRRRARARGPEQIIWDAKVAGFGARRQKGPGASYFLFYRTEEGRQRWQTIGRHGSALDAGKCARRSSPAARRGSRGRRPCRGKSLQAARRDGRRSCVTFILPTLRRAAADATPQGEEGVDAIDRQGQGRAPHKAALGSLKVASVTREDIDGFLHDVAAGKTQARVRRPGSCAALRMSEAGGGGEPHDGLLGAIFSYAVR